MSQERKKERKNLKKVDTIRLTQANMNSSMQSTNSLFIYLSIDQSVCLSLSVYLSVCLSINESDFRSKNLTHIYTHAHTHTHTHTCAGIATIYKQHKGMLKHIALFPEFKGSVFLKNRHFYPRKVY